MYHDRATRDAIFNYGCRDPKLCGISTKDARAIKRSIVDQHKCRSADSGIGEIIDNPVATCESIAAIMLKDGAISKPAHGQVISVAHGPTHGYKIGTYWRDDVHKPAIRRSTAAIGRKKYQSRHVPRVPHTPAPVRHDDVVDDVKGDMKSDDGSDYDSDNTPPVAELPELDDDDIRDFWAMADVFIPPDNANIQIRDFRRRYNEMQANYPAEYAYLADRLPPDLSANLKAAIISNGKDTYDAIIADPLLAGFVAH